jgi:hypothetical protein
VVDNSGDYRIPHGDLLLRFLYEDCLGLYGGNGWGSNVGANAYRIWNHVSRAILRIIGVRTLFGLE